MRLTRGLIMQKARRHSAELRPLVSARFQVLFHSPHRGSFHLSVTLLSSLSVVEEYLALEGGPPIFNPGSTSPSLLYGLNGHYRTFTFFGPAFQPVRMVLSAFARRYLRSRCCFPFLRVLRCFSSPGSPHAPMHSVRDTPKGGFPHSEIHRSQLGYQLPVAYRRFQRPSSPLDAKSSTARPLSLPVSPVLRIVRHLSGVRARLSARGPYFPMQKVAKTLPSTSSGVSRPPSASRASSAARMWWAMSSASSRERAPRCSASPARARSRACWAA
jgi:hypothetical protein